VVFEGVELQLESGGGTGGKEGSGNQDADSGRTQSADQALPGGGEANSTGGLTCLGRQTILLIYRKHYAHSILPSHLDKLMCCFCILF
jgi:hypothetical protein